MPEKEYIERGALIDNIIESRENSPYTDTEADLVHRIEHNNFLSLVANQPAADVVQIVRCKDCKYYEKITNTGKNGGEMWCRKCGALAKVRQDGESFCSFAERKENDDVG